MATIKRFFLEIYSSIIKIPSTCLGALYQLNILLPITVLYFMLFMYLRCIIQYQSIKASITYAAEDAFILQLARFNYIHSINSRIIVCMENCINYIFYRITTEMKKSKSKGGM